jgi:2-phospho-L-lactate transferase/gluconeogenesis factor (CofD/UPF0052 family)
VPELAAAVTRTAAARCLVVNLDPQTGETSGFAPETYLDELVRHAPELRLDVVIADSDTVRDTHALETAAARLGATLLLAPLLMADGTPRHDPVLLARAFHAVMSPRGQE